MLAGGTPLVEVGTDPFTLKSIFMFRTNIKLVVAIYLHV